MAHTMNQSLDINYVNASAAEVLSKDRLVIGVVLNMRGIKMSDLSIKIRDLCSSLNSIADEVQKIEDRINHLEIEQSQDNMMMKNIAEAINKRYN